MSDLYKGLASASIDLQHQGSESIPIGRRPIALKVHQGYGPIAAYSTGVMAATGMLLGLMLANSLGFPEAVSRPFAAFVLVIILHPIALPYVLATVVAGFRTAHGPATDAVWDVVFLASFAPYLLVLCWLAVGRLRVGRRVDAVGLASLVCLYVCVVEFIVLAQDTVVRVG